MMRVSPQEARKLILSGKAPKGLMVAGCLDFSGHFALPTLPEGLTVDDALNLSRCKEITALPEGLTAAYLSLRDCTGLTALPEHLSVHLDLDLRGCTGLRKFPESLNGCHVNEADEARPYLQAIAEEALTPNALDMDAVHSGTAHDIAGWAGVLFPGQVREGYEMVDAINLLGWEAARHFHDSNDEAREFLEQLGGEGRVMNMRQLQIIYSALCTGLGATHGRLDVGSSIWRDGYIRKIEFAQRIVLGEIEALESGEAEEAERRLNEAKGVAA